MRRGLITARGYRLAARLARGSKIPRMVKSSCPWAHREEIFALGRKLRPLRENGILIAGSGGIVHNLGLVHFADKGAGVRSLGRRVRPRGRRPRGAPGQRVAFPLSHHGPGAAMSVPTPEHYDPLFITLGAAWPNEALETVYEGFHDGNISMRSVAFS